MKCGETLEVKCFLIIMAKYLIPLIAEVKLLSLLVQYERLIELKLDKIHGLLSKNISILRKCYI